MLYLLPESAKITDLVAAELVESIMLDHGEIDNFGDEDPVFDQSSFDLGYGETNDFDDEYPVLDQESLDEEAEKLDAFIKQHHGFTRRAELNEVPFPEVEPFTWEKFLIWWEITPRPSRERLLSSLERYIEDY